MKIVQENKDKQIIAEQKNKLIGSWLALRSYETKSVSLNYKSNYPTFQKKEEANEDV